MAEEFDIGNDLGELDEKYGTGTKTRSVSPEEESFKSVYIAGKKRKNDKEIIEEPGKIQIRGYKYNLDEIYFMVTHVKKIYANRITVKKRESVKCFSYQVGEPFTGYNGRGCPRTSTERKNDEFCNGCKEDIIISGPLCDKNGKVDVDDEKKPIMIFLRGRGGKYYGISSYLDEVTNEKYEEYLLDQSLSANRYKEHRLINHKRYIVKVTPDTYDTDFGEKNTFKLEKSKLLPLKTVVRLIKLASEKSDVFDDKFDWSRHKSSFSKQSDENGGYDYDKEENEMKDNAESIIDDSLDDTVNGLDDLDNFSL